VYGAIAVAQNATVQLQTEVDAILGASLFLLV